MNNWDPILEAFIYLGSWMKSICRCVHFIQLIFHNIILNENNSMIIEDILLLMKSAFLKLPF